MEQDVNSVMIIQNGLPHRSLFTNDVANIEHLIFITILYQKKVHQNQLPIILIASCTIRLITPFTFASYKIRVMPCWQQAVRITFC